jgi:hypothetical protein
MRTVDRTGSLRLGGTGLPGAFLLGTTRGSIGRAFARAKPSLAKGFEAVATGYGVPEELLLAVGYANTLWEMPPPTATGGAPTASCSSCGAPLKTPWGAPPR